MACAVADAAMTASLASDVAWADVAFTAREASFAPERR